MSEETFSTLTPEQGDTPEILRMKLGVAASRLAAVLQDGVAVDLAAAKVAVESLAMAGLATVPSDVSSMRSLLVETLLLLVQQLVPLPATPSILEFVSYGTPLALAYSGTYFRKAVMWGANLNGVPNYLAVTVKHGNNCNRTISPGGVIVVEAASGQLLDLQNFVLVSGYYGDALTVELF